MACDLKPGVNLKKAMIPANVNGNNFQLLFEYYFLHFMDWFIIFVLGILAELVQK